MTEKSSALHHDLRQQAIGDRILRALEVAASHAGANLNTIPVVTFQITKSNLPLKIYRQTILVFGDLVVEVKPPDAEDIDAGTAYKSIELALNREPSEEERKLIEKLLGDFDDLLLTLPEKEGVTVGIGRKPKSGIERPLTTEPTTIDFSESRKYRILALVHGEFGKRKVKNIRERGPDHWVVEIFELPVDLPALIDDPQDYLPVDVPEADLVLALQENPNAAQLIVDYVRLSKAKALLAPIDNSEWMPEGQKNQIQRQLANNGVASAFPRPFCVFEESGDPFLDEFAKYFGRPVLEVKWEKDNITDVKVVRGAPCGCTLFVMDKLKGARVDESVEIAGLAHHHYPCLASMTREPDLDDTLMHKSGYMTKEVVDKQIDEYKKKHATYIDPAGIK